MTSSIGCLRLRLWPLAFAVFALAAPWTGAQTIPNPSFEANTFSVTPGYASINGGVITGWTISDPTRIGLNTSAGPFADNGAIPDGVNIAFIQSVGAAETLSTTISGLTVGVPYQVSFRANRRYLYDLPVTTWSVNGGAFGPFTAAPAVGGSNPYYTNSAIFTATATTAALALRNSIASGDSTVLVDDFTITPVVTVTNDSGVGSLRSVLGSVPGGSTITFSPLLAGQTITLTSGQITLSQNVTIDASALPGGIQINGNHASRLFTVNGGVTVMCKALTITNGNDTSASAGGGILNSGTLTLTNCTLAGNTTASASAGGGAIHSGGTLTLNNCTVSGNSSGGYGGGIGNAAGTLTVNNCTFTGNSATNEGGGIVIGGGTVIVNSSTFVSNSAPLVGGGGIANSSGTLKLTNSIVAGNLPSLNDLIGTVSGSGNLTNMPTPQLAPLGNYGGLTATMPPLFGSAAINMGDDAVASGLVTDQRGLPRLSGTHVDIGAVEFQVGLTAATNADSGENSLRADVIYNPPGSLISIDPSLSGESILLTSGVIFLSQNVIIDSSALSAGLVLDGNSGSTVFSVNEGVTATLNFLTVSNGFSPGYDGGIYNNGALTMNDCTVVGNLVDADGGGGGILNDGDGVLVMNNCTVTRNAAGDNTGGNLGGGGVFNLFGVLTMNNCTVAGNSVTGSDYAGGIYNFSGTVNLTNTIVSGNIAPNDIVGSFAGVSNLVGVAGIKLAALGNYGGLTQTLPPLAGSPAIDAGSDTVTNLLLTDQRGQLRLSGLHVDIGAVEVNTNSIVTTAADILPGSLRSVVAAVMVGDLISFAPNLSGQTILLTGGSITLGQNVSIDGSALANGIQINGNAQSGIFTASGGTVTLNALTFTNGSNGFGGAIANYSALTVNNCTFAGNQVGTGGFSGGAIANVNGPLSVNNCTFTGNQAAAGTQGGGALFTEDGTLTVNNCTIVGNHADSTIHGGGGILKFINHPTLFVTNSIVCSNSASSGPDIGGTYFGGNNLVGLNPLLAPLGNYGGPTPTMLPLPGSPAIDAGIVVPGLTTDQRGFPRLRGLASDIGADEANNPVVANNSGSGNGSFSQIISNSLPGDYITFAPNLSGATISPAAEIAVTNNNIVIDATGLPGGLTISGNNSHRIFTVPSGQTVSLSGLTLTGGNGAGPDNSGFGGAIINSGALSLTQCILSGNNAVNGGALANAGTMTLSQCALLNNRSTSDAGAILNEATLTLTQCTLANNQCPTYGGALLNFSGTTSLLQCTLANNQAGQYGGGILMSGGTTALTHCTLSGNSAVTAGGGIFISGATTLTNCIVGDNTAALGPDIWNNGAALTLVGENIIPYLKSANGSTQTGPFPITTDPMLAALGNYGGFTQTMPPLPGSPAIDAATAIGLTADQRGSFRPLGAAPDLGAVESGGLWVQNTNDIGANSLRNVLTNTASITNAKTVIFVPGLSGTTITLASEIVLTNNVSIDASSLAAGLTLNGGQATRLFTIAGGADASLAGLTLTGGNGAGALSSGEGGAVLVAFSATLGMTRCTLSGNHASGDGGAFASAGAITVLDCTLSGNQAAGYGGAIENQGALLLLDCTVSANTAAGAGGGIDNYLNHLTLNNCIVAGNTGIQGNDINNDTAIVSRTNANIVQALFDIDGATETGPAAINAAPLLAPLGNYGGPTQTMPPLPTSPAVDAGGPPNAAMDQRSYPRIAGVAMDIGAVEGIYIAAGSGKIRSVSQWGNGSIQFSFTNLTDANFAVLASTNISQPTAAWTPIGFVTETAPGSGHYQFTDSQPANEPQRFYGVK